MAATLSQDGEPREGGQGPSCNRRVLSAGYDCQMATVLITQCLQRDFVDPIGPHDPLPNLLHVGYSEAMPAEGQLKIATAPSSLISDASNAALFAASANEFLNP